jgi:pimeloyl-ACP methyl ester carboxylesterase
MNRRTFLAASAAAMAVAGAARAAVAIDAAAFQASRRFVDTRFGRIAYVERGKGPAAVFIHGYPLNGFQWRGALERLAGKRRCIALDSMGLGYSEIPEGQDLTPAAQARMIAAVLDALAIPAADLVANDSGGAIAQIFALRYPDRVRSLLLTNCDVPFDDTPALKPAIDGARAGTFADRFLLPQLADKAMARSARGLGGLAYTNPANLTDEAIDCYLKPLVATPLRKAQLHGYTLGLDPNPLIGMEADMGRSQVPLRVVWGMGDGFFKTSDADWLDHAYPRSRGVRRVEGAKLFFPEEMPDLIAEEAARLWAAASA